MSREIEVNGQCVQVLTTSDIAPNGIEELEELCKTARPSKAGFWSTQLQAAQTEEASPQDFREAMESMRRKDGHA